MHLDHIQYFDQLKQEELLDNIFYAYLQCTKQLLFRKIFLTVDKYLTYYKVRVGKMPGHLSTKYRMHLSSKKKYLLVPGVAAEM